MGKGGAAGGFATLNGSGKIPESQLPSDGGKPVSVTVTLAANAWSNNAQTVTVSGVLADETKQLIQPVPASASSAEYESCGVKATAQAADSLTFSCNTAPTNNLTIYVVITEVAT